MFIGSMPGAAAGAEDYASTEGGEKDQRRYIYSIMMSKADFLAIVGAKNDYGDAYGPEEDAVEAVEGAIVAFGVRADEMGDAKGIAYASAAVALVVEK